MKRSEIIKSGGTLSTSIDGDMVETNLPSGRKASIHYQLGKPIVYNQPSQLSIRLVPPLHKKHLFEEGVNLCIPNYENYKIQLYPEAYISYRDYQQFDTQKVLQKSYEDGNPVRILWLIPIGTSIYAVVWRHTLFLKCGGPNGDPDSPRTTNSILTEMTNATAEQIDNDITLPLQMMYLCERESGPLVGHTFNKSFEININFGTAQFPDYQKIHYSFTVTHDFITGGTYYDSFKRDVTWELKWNDDVKISGYSHIKRNAELSFPYTIFAHWYRCKFFNVYDEYQPWNWNNDNDFEYDFDHMYQPFYLFYDYPQSLVTNDGKCDTYAKDMTSGYPEYLGGAILTKDLIYMELQEYYLDYTQEPNNSSGSSYTEDCDNNGINETYYYWNEFHMPEKYDQYVHEHIVCKSGIGLNFDLLRHTESNSIDEAKICRAYSTTSGASTACPCDFYTVGEGSTYELHKFHHIPVPRLDRLRPQSPCETIFFDFYEDVSDGTYLFILGLWQTLSKGKQLFTYRDKCCHKQNTKIILWIKRPNQTWHEVTNSDIPNIELVKNSLQDFLSDNKFTPVTGFNPNWEAFSYENNVTYYRNNCIFGHDAVLKHTVLGEDTICNVKKTQIGELEWDYTTQITPGVSAIQYYVRGINGWNLSGNWYDYCTVSRGYWYEGTHYMGNANDYPPYPVEQCINEVGCFSSWRAFKFPLFSLGSVLVTDSDMVI